jgi:hypothetical protein
MFFFVFLLVAALKRRQTGWPSIVDVGFEFTQMREKGKNRPITFGYGL